jgi:hypothetical protein
MIACERSSILWSRFWKYCSRRHDGSLIYKFRKCNTHLGNLLRLVTVKVRDEAEL